MRFVRVEVVSFSCYKYNMIASLKLSKTHKESRKKMELAGCNQPSINYFLSLLTKISSGYRGLLKLDDDIRKVSEKKVFLYEDIKLKDNTHKLGEANLGKVAVLKLNGGLGTSMGLHKAKSLLPVTEDGKTYIDLIITQIESLRKDTGINIPLIFMNSFSTQKDTLEYIRDNYPEFKNEGIGLDILQNKYPKLKTDTLMPASHTNDQYNWSPPGHGDVYTVLYSSGILESMLLSGIKYLFVSNADNLAATIDSLILGFMIENDVPFVMETARRTESDKKGGHLAEDLKGNLVLRELANCSEDEVKNNFEDLELWTDFNTNNIWIKLEALKDILDKNNSIMPLDLIVNIKNNNSSSSATAEDIVKVYQLETAMGSAIRYFPSACAIRIDTNKRFFPTKKVSDLMLLLSDAVYYNDKGSLLLKNGREKPVIILSSQYSTVQDLYELCPEGVPSLKLCNRLEIVGSVSFGANVEIKGFIKIINHTKNLFNISQGSVITEDIFVNQD